jgi:hypothetical protein
VGSDAGWVSGGPGQYYWKGGDGGPGIADASVGGLLSAASVGVSGYIAGGGGGSCNWQDDLYGAFGTPYGVPGLGGVGGGGSGGEQLSMAPHYNLVQGVYTTASTTGTVNTGSGGGGGYPNSGGSGGSGIIVIGY